MSATPPKTPPRPPEKPQDFECCNRGCCPCIFDYYYDAMERWEARVTELGFEPKALLADGFDSKPSTP